MEQCIALLPSEAARTCAQRFAKAEGHVDSNPKGLGRVSAVGFPRLGSVIGLRPGDPRETMVVAALEEALQAAYLTTLRLLAENDMIHERADWTPQGRLWEEWIPIAFNGEGEFEDIVLGQMFYDRYWMWFVDAIDQKKLVKQFKKAKATPLMRSLGGLSRPGMNLALAEASTPL
jgi:hypothetical protein